MCFSDFPLQLNNGQIWWVGGYGGAVCGVGATDAVARLDVDALPVWAAPAAGCGLSSCSCHTF